jgi:hypothetical protein
VDLVLFVRRGHLVLVARVAPLYRDDDIASATHPLKVWEGQRERRPRAGRQPPVLRRAGRARLVGRPLGLLEAAPFVWGGFRFILATPELLLSPSAPTPPPPRRGGGAWCCHSAFDPTCFQPQAESALRRRATSRRKRGLSSVTLEIGDVSL